MRFFGFIYIFVAFNSWSITGEYTDPKNHFEGTCKISFSFIDYNQKKWTGICSSNYMGNGIFSTADHCRDNINQNLWDQSLAPPIVSCPNEEPQPIIKTFLPKDSGLTDHLDFSLFKIEKILTKTQPFQLPKNKEEVMQLLQKKENCFVGGYGYDNEKNYGVLKAAKVTNIDLNPISFFGDAKEGKVRLRENRGDHGDSGGSLYCKTEKGVILVGVIADGAEGMNYSDVELIDRYVDWIQNILNSPSFDERSYSLWRTNLDTCQKLLRCRSELQKIGTFTKEIDQILEKLMLDQRNTNQKFSQFQVVEEVEVQNVWDEMINFWEKYDCYHKLNP